MMQVSKFTRVWRDAVTACVTPKPKAVAKAFDVGQVNLAPGVIFGFGVPHDAVSTPERHLLTHRESYAAKQNPYEEMAQEEFRPRASLLRVLVILDS